MAGFIILHWTDYGPIITIRASRFDGGEPNLARWGISVDFPYYEDVM